VISEFRLRGPNGVNDEFIEIYNDSAADHTVAAISGTGYGIAASDGILRCTIPNGTVIPARGHFLCTNSVGYSYSAYPSGNGTTATGDATYAVDIADNAGIALFNNNIVANFSVANRFDAVGSTSEADTTYKEGTGYPALTPFSIEYSWSRDECGKQGINTSFGACPSGGLLLDTDNNAADFIFNDTNGTSAGGGQRLGAPGPQNLSSPIHGGGSFSEASLDPCGALEGGSANFARDFTSVPAQNSTFGTIDVRRTFTNHTGAPVTRLRYRIVDLTTFPAPSGFADLRPLTSADTVVTVDRAPCGAGTSNVTVTGTTLDVDNTAPSTGQPNGGGWNSSWSSNSVTLGTPLANGASIDVRFLMGLQQTGRFKLGLLVETLPSGSNAVFQISGCTDSGACSANFTKGDFNSDGMPDIVFRNVAAGQQNKVWFMNAKTRTSEAAISPDAASADWLIRGVDDFNADGRTDLVFWNQLTGAVEFWLMNGTTRTGAAVPLSGGAVLPTNWSLSATADFNADGNPDIVWRNLTSQKIVVWTMIGTAKTGALIPSPDQAVDANWTIVAAADYNHDGNTDFLWYNNTSGNIVTWYMGPSPTLIRISGQFTNPISAGDSNWKVVASADYSGSDMPGTPPAGSPDILWRNATSGNQVIWHLNFGSTRILGEFTDPFANTPALNWVVVGPR
jgi:hypothetical protein